MFAKGDGHVLFVESVSFFSCNLIVRNISEDVSKKNVVKRLSTRISIDDYDGSFVATGD